MSNRNDQNSIRNHNRVYSSPNTKIRKTYKHKDTHICYFLDIVLEHAMSKVCQDSMNACAYLKPASCMNFGQDFLCLLKSSTYGPVNITKETRFDMEYMPTQTINLTVPIV